MAASEYTRTIGQIDDDRKVHLAHGISQQHILCRFGSAKRATTITLAEIADDADLCDVLLAAEVKISHLCCHCFAIRTRTQYRAHIQAAIAALPATD
jgi:hypothetical protein